MHAYVRRNPEPRGAGFLSREDKDEITSRTSLERLSNVSRTSLERLSNVSRTSLSVHPIAVIRESFTFRTRTFTFRQNFQNSLSWRGSLVSAPSSVSGADQEPTTSIRARSSERNDDETCSAFATLFESVTTRNFEHIEHRFKGIR